MIFMKHVLDTIWVKIYALTTIVCHSDIYETCVERNLGQKIRLLLRRQSFVKQPLQNIGSGDHLPLENQTVSSFK